MRKVSSYRCPVCKMEYKTLSGWADHMHRHHPEEIPEGFTDLQYFYFTITGKKAGSCVQCHRPTDWNEASGKYNRYCNNPKCKEQYCKVAKQRMIDKYGKVHLLNDPEKQREMLSHRHISGTYTFSDGSGKLGYVGSYEKDFLVIMDTVLGFKASDIMSPSPHNYVYMYEGQPHYYIPDFYIPNLNLEIEIKDDMNGPNANKHPKITAVDRVKEALKDEVMAKNKSINYFKVMDKSYDAFFKYLLDLKDGIDDDLKNTIVSKMALESANDFEVGLDAVLEAAYDISEYVGEGEYGLESVTQPEILYHGSPKKLDVLKPFVSTHGKAYVYASPDYNFALCYAGKPWDDFKINQSVYNGHVVLTEIEKGAFREYFDCPGYMYSFPADEFKTFPGAGKSELVSTSEVHATDVRYIPNVLSEIKNSDIKLYTYPNLPTFIRDRGEYIQSRKARFGIESATESIKDSLNFETPEELHSWMKSNFTYANFTHLLSPEEMQTKKHGSCHDQTLFAYKYLKKMGLSPRILFFLSYKEGNPTADMTHSFCTYKKDNKIWWFETAWNGNIGLRSYNTENELKTDVYSRYQHLPNAKEYPELEFSWIKPQTPGINLAQFVSNAMEVALATDERTDFGIPSLKKYPMPDESHVRSAIRMFNYVDEEHEEELAKNILKYMKKYGIKDISIGKSNRFSKYYSPVEDSVITDVSPQVPYGGAMISRPV